MFSHDQNKFLPIDRGLVKNIKVLPNYNKNVLRRDKDLAMKYQSFLEKIKV